MLPRGSHPLLGPSPQPHGQPPCTLPLGPWPLITLTSASFMCGAEVEVQGGHWSHFSENKSLFLPLRDEVSRQVIFIAGLRQDPSEKINKVTHTSPSHPSASSLERAGLAVLTKGCPLPQRCCKGLLVWEGPGPSWGRDAGSRASQCPLLWPPGVWEQRTVSQGPISQLGPRLCLCRRVKFKFRFNPNVLSACQGPGTVLGALTHFTRSSSLNPQNSIGQIVSTAMCSVLVLERQG